MSSSPNLRKSDADEQAALWAARLDGASLKDGDYAELRVWLDQDPSHRTLLSDYCQFSADLERRLPDLVEAGLVELPATRIPVRRRRMRAWIFTLAGTCAAAAAVAFLWFARPQTQYEAYATSMGQRKSITLYDGTHIELNADTSLLVETDKRRRHVRLASGEAFFHVAKDPSRPFTVSTPSGSVRVTGTVFDVSTDAKSDIDVTVVEGHVLVHPSQTGTTSHPEVVALSAGDSLAADAKGVTVRHLSDASVQDALAWRTGQVVFDGTPLREALARFARYHGRGITASEAAGKLRLGGRYSLDDLDGFLSNLEEALPVKVTQDSSGTIRVSLRSEP